MLVWGLEPSWVLGCNLHNSGGFYGQRFFENWRNSGTSYELEDLGMNWLCKSKMADAGARL